MKKIIFCLIILSCIADYSQAAFVVKKAAVTNATVVSGDNATSKTTTGHVRHTLINRIESRLLSRFQGDEGWDYRGEGSRAMFWAIWGIFIWPLGILAVLHAVNGLHSKNGHEQDKATIALIFGIGECVLTLFAIIWILSAPVWWYY